MCGELSYVLSNDPTVIDCQSSVLIPVFCPPVTLSIISSSPALSYVLIVEKHTVYNVLLAHRYHLTHHCVLITGKGPTASTSPLNYPSPWSLLTARILLLFVSSPGYPCFSTRVFLQSVHSAFPHLPLLALVDCDPHGLSIFSTYKFGGARSSWEKLSLPSIQHLGLDVDEVIELHHILDSQDPSHQRRDGLCLAPLTAKDRRKVELMMRDDAALQDRKLRGELEGMLAFDHKAEVECLEGYAPNYLCNDYLPWKVQQAMAAQVEEGGEAEEDGGEEEAKAKSAVNQRRQEAGQRVRTARAGGVAVHAERSLSQR